MKLHFFHFMPYRFLPDDFRQKYKSVWVDIPSELIESAECHQLYNEYLDQLEYAASQGFDGICLNEHHQSGYSLMPSPNLLMASLARATDRYKTALIVLGNSLTLYDPPTRVAEEFAMLDCLSGGRLVAGFPVGLPMDAAFSHGNSPAIIREKYFEAHDLIMQAWHRPEVFAFNGKHTQLRYVNTLPKPLQKPHPPVWIPGTGSLETWEWVTQRDYIYCYLSFYGYQSAIGVLEGFWEEVARQGKEFNPYRAGFIQFVGVSETDDQAERDYKPHLDYFFQRCLHINPSYRNIPGYRSQKSSTQGRSQPQVPVEFTWKEYLEKGYIIAGSPETVRQQLEELAKALRVGHLMTMLQFGSAPPDLVTQNTTLFAQQVMPALRSLWSDYEDHWWIKPLSQAPVAQPLMTI